MSRRTGSFTAALVRPRYLLIAAAIALLPTSSTAQDTTRVPAAPAPTVAVLKRLAEAVDGYPVQGRSVFVVLDSAQEVAAVVGSLTAADSVLRTLRRGQIHGPYRPAPSSRLSLLPGCIHIMSAMTGICP